MRSPKFNFDFNLTYKELSTQVKKLEERGGGTYHYLQNKDRFHDVLERSIKYFESIDTDIDTNYFKSVFWKSWKFNNLESFAKVGKKSNESESTTYGVSDDLLVTYQPDFDQRELINKIRTLPTVSKVMEGYNARELAEEVGMSRHTFYQRYYKELKKIMV